MTLILHLGTHKTGTTSVQLFANSHRSELRSKGLWYPSYGLVDRPEHYAHHHLVNTAVGADNEYLTTDDALRLVRAIETGTRPGEVVLISGESAYRNVRNRRGAGDYWKARRAYIKALRDLFPGPDVRILFYLRRQDHYIESYFKERIRRMPYTKNFHTFLDEERCLLQYDTQLELFSDYFPRVDIRVYEDNQGEILPDFFQKLGIDVQEYAPFRRANESLAIEWVEYKRQLNLAGVDMDTMGVMERTMVRRLHDRPDPFKPSVWMTWAQRRELVDSFGPTNEAVKSRFLPNRDKPLFPPVDDEPDAEYVADGISLTRFAELTAQIYFQRT